MIGFIQVHLDAYGVEPTCNVLPIAPSTHHDYAAKRRDPAGETVTGRYRAEVIQRRGPWRSFEAVEFATLEWVDWFNNRRLFESIGNFPPAEAEERYYAILDQPAMAA